ncbi:hypothetical protein ABIE13_005113 [Ottowia thiooxydans]|uniref:Uncharacterized protein n=1 Tax=Ottowia thiooxydans TaxID=219182 RepID=A0ABV2QHD0_9BURK
MVVSAEVAVNRVHPVHLYLSEIPNIATVGGGR